jgi:hypothetical protein
VKHPGEDSHIEQEMNRIMKTFADSTKYAQLSTILPQVVFILVEVHRKLVGAVRTVKCFEL